MSYYKQWHSNILDFLNVIVLLDWLIIMLLQLRFLELLLSMPVDERLGGSSRDDEVLVRDVTGDDSNAEAGEDDEAKVDPATRIAAAATEATLSDTVTAALAVGSVRIEKSRTPVSCQAPNPWRPRRPPPPM